MVPVGAGQITLKDEGTNRLWKVGIEPFLLGRVAVTQALYSAFSNPLAASGLFDNRHKPVVNVTWIDAIRFCNLLAHAAGLPQCYSWDADGEVCCDWKQDGYRLPLEAEWEFACRAGSSVARYGELDEIAWYRSNSGDGLHDVGTRSPNDGGLFDMLGNAWEWCWDVYDASTCGPYRVFRGGGWSDLPRACRASCRRKCHPTFRVDDLGFRLARSVK